MTELTHDQIIHTRVDRDTARLARQIKAKGRNLKYMPLWVIYERAMRILATQEGINVE